MSEMYYALYVVGGREEEVVKYLKGYFGERLKFYVYTRTLKERRQGQWELVTRKLFPGYIIIEGELDVKVYKELLNLPESGKVLTQEDVPAVIPRSELEVLGLLTKVSNGDIGLSSYYRVADGIRVVDGPMLGHEGLIVSVDGRKQRAKVRLNFMGEARIVELGLELITKSME